MCLNVIKVSVYLQNWSHVVSYVNKAMNTPDLVDGGSSATAAAAANGGSASAATVKAATPDGQALLTRLSCASGLADLATRKYKSAAKHFLSAHADHCDMPDLLSAQNVATYGGLCALATLDRPELHRMVITSSGFKLFLELDPQLREVRGRQFLHV